MSFLSSIRFGSSPAQAVPVQPQPNLQPTNPQGQGNQQNNAALGSGGPVQKQDGPANSQMNTGNPLDAFTSFLTPSKDVVEANNARQSALAKPLFEGVNPEAIRTSVNKTDFTTGLNPETLQKAMSGSDPQAFMDVLNTVARNSANAAMVTSHNMVERGVTTGLDRFGGTLDSRMREFQVNGQTSKNPALSHPIGEAMMKSFTKQIAQANPQLSPQDAAAQAENMLLTFSRMAIQPEEDSNKAAAAKSGPQAQDWENWFDNDPGNSN